MSARKAIACIIATPESAYQQRLLTGIMAQVDRYGYDLQVFCPLVSLGNPYEEYVNQDLNILNLINFDLVEGVVVATRSFIINNENTILNKVEKLIKKKCKKPVVCIDLEMGGYDTVHLNKAVPFKDIAAHIFGKKKCKNAIFLTGTSDNEKTNVAYKAIISAAKTYGVSKEKIKIEYGDFWYTGGKKLAESIIEKKIKLPDAVICENDYMALGLENQLSRNGIKCPEDVLITGYEATQDAFLNDVTITSYVPLEERMAMEAVNLLVSKISPNTRILRPKPHHEEGLIEAGSTNSPLADVKVYKNAVKDWIYKVNRSEEEWQAREFFDIGRLMESYMFEDLTEKNSPLDCLYRIFINGYLLEPFSAVYLNLCPDWLDTTVVRSQGYPSKMLYAIDKISQKHPDYVSGRNYYTLDKDHTFSTKRLLPAMEKDWKKPQVYYFISLHFASNTLGYSVLQFDCDRLLSPTAMHRNWYRNVQNALEMIRTKNRLYSQSLVDGLTGVYNRNKFKDLCTDGTKALVAEKVGIMMLDIDFFKKVNDTYGHSVGDEVLKRITFLAKSCIRETDMVIRWGGEEFVIFCLGCDNEDRLYEIAEKIRKTIEADQSMVTKITVSIGVSVYDGENYEVSVAKADKALYYAKRHGRNQVVIHSK
ncbi:MAG: GGDEF domain-containing protein [Treponema sp.]|nr:GGDEF domain-containing protein [Treponema sp.]